MALAVLPLHDVDVENFYVGERLLVVGPRILDLVDHVEPLRRTAKDRVLPVEPRLEKKGVSKVPGDGLPWGYSESEGGLVSG